MKKSFTTFIHKEFLHILRDPRTMLIALLIPVVQMILFGFAISMEVNSVDVAVVAPVVNPAVEAKVAQLAHNPYVAFTGYIDAADVDRTLASNRAQAVVVFGRDYNVSGAVQVVADGSNPVAAQTSTGYLTQILSAGSASSAPGITILYNPQLKSAYNFVPGIMGMIFMLICAMLTSVSIVREKETGTMEVLLVSPIRPQMIVIAKLIPYFMLACVDLVLILLVSKFALGVPLSGSIAALVVISLIYIILSLALGLFVSTMVNSQMAALLISGMVFIMPVVMLSGMMFPIENMPAVLQWVSNIVPARWYIPAMRKIMVEGLGFGHVYQELAVISVMALALIAISIKRFKIRLQ